MAKPRPYRVAAGYGLAVLAALAATSIAAPELGSPPHFSSLARLAALSALVADARAGVSPPRYGHAQIGDRVAVGPDGSHAASLVLASGVEAARCRTRQGGLTIQLSASEPGLADEAR